LSFSLESQLSVVGLFSRFWLNIQGLRQGFMISFRGIKFIYYFHMRGDFVMHRVLIFISQIFMVLSFNEDFLPEYWLDSRCFLYCQLA
jgi:hypothetical protein